MLVINNAQCFQNNHTCATKSVCFIFSLDSILGYHIKPNVIFTRQPLIIKISLVINLIILILGLISGVFSIITFSKKKSKEVGRGY
ncbi:unnamed protein product [Rotaria sp. Silwood1]|nr:unnamed protein product [Rotaria sp. Silwood1]